MPNGVMDNIYDTLDDSPVVGVALIVSTVLYARSRCEAESCAPVQKPLTLVAAGVPHHRAGRSYLISERVHRPGDWHLLSRYVSLFAFFFRSRSMRWRMTHKAANKQMNVHTNLIRVWL